MTTSEKIESYPPLMFTSPDGMAEEAAKMLEGFAATVLKDIEGMRTQLENVDLTIEQVRLIQGRIREARRMHGEYVRQFGASASSVRYQRY